MLTKRLTLERMGIKPAFRKRAGSRALQGNGLKIGPGKINREIVWRLIGEAGKSGSPADFLLKRGLNAEILRKFDVRLPLWSISTRQPGSPTETRDRQEHVYSAKDLRRLGYSAKELLISRYKFGEILKAYPLHELIDTVSNPLYLEKLGVSRKRIAEAIATSNALRQERTRLTKERKIA